MSIMYISIPHSLTKEDAIFRMKRLFGDLEIKFPQEISSLREEWHIAVDHFDVTARGMPFSGTMEVRDREVLVALQPPPEAGSLAPHVEMHIRTMAETLLR